MMIHPGKYETRFCMLHFLAVILVPLALLAMLAAGYFSYLPLKVEVYTLAMVAFIFFVFVCFVRHNAYFALCMITKSLRVLDRHIQKALDENSLTIMGKTKSTLDIRKFVAEYYRDVRHDNFARIAPGVFPMLGILGTFTAIAISMPDFTVSNVEALDKQLTLLLAGIGTAFYASIYGIVLSLVWIFFEQQGEARAERYIMELEQFYDDRLWKESELVKHQHQQKALEDMEIVKTLKEIFNLDFIRELNGQYIKNSRLIIGETTDSFGQVAKELQQAADRLEKLAGVVLRKRDMN
jgi:biopolymer transport protein ExbB/TolQ